MDFNTMLICELGPFIYGKTSWLEYQNKLDTFFDEHDVWSDRRRDVCVSMIGARTLKILKNLNPQNIQDVDYQTIVEKLESHFYPKQTQVHYVFKFCHRVQKKRESFFKYVVALRKLIQNCSYDDPEVHLKLQIMDGVRDIALKKEFQGTNKNNLSLTRTFEIGLAYDDARAFKAAPHPRNHKARINREKTCFRCKESILRHHENITCPFEWAECEHCHIIGHLSIACKYKDSVCNYCSQKGHICRICVRRTEDNVGPRNLSMSVTSHIKEDGTKEKILTVSNLRMNTIEDELRNYFGKYGELRSVKVEEDSITNKFNGTAQIIYKYAKPYKKVLADKIHML